MNILDCLIDMSKIENYYEVENVSIVCTKSQSWFLNITRLTV